MNDFLQYLNDLTQPAILWPKCIEKIQICDPFWEQVLALTSTEVVNQFTDALDNIEDEKRLESFSRGFRLGAQAMLAVLTPLSAGHP